VVLERVHLSVVDAEVGQRFDSEVVFVRAIVALDGVSFKESPDDGTGQEEA
jgi:hypothetical protein